MGITVNTFDELPSTTTLSKQVESRIREAIVSGKMQPGVLFTETTIAAQMRVSRTPVREAVLNLEEKGLVTIFPKRGFQIRAFSREVIHEVYDLRWALESHALRTLGTGTAKHNLKLLAQAAEQQKEKAIKAEIGNAVQSGEDFHKELLRLSGNGMMCKIFEDIRDIISITWAQAFTHSISAVEVAGDHIRLVELLKKGKTEAACDLLKTHLERSEKAVLEALEITMSQNKLNKQ